MRSSKVSKQDFARAAWKLGCAGGYDAVKIRAIADDAGVSGALIYSYYEDKASLMDALRGIGAQLLDAQLDDEMRRPGPAALLRLTSRYIAYMREHAWLYLGESKLELHGPNALHAQCFIRRAASLLEAGDPDQVGGHAQAKTLATHLWLSLRGVVLVPSTSVKFDQAFVDAHAVLCVRAISARSARSAPYVVPAVAAHAPHLGT